MSKRVDGKVALVTGAASGLGLAGATLLAREGARVVMMDIASTVEDRVADARQQGLDVTAHVGDVSVEEDVRRMINVARETYGRLDILWNNAGIVSNEWVVQDTDVVGISMEYLMRTIEVNMGGAFLGCKYAIPLMAETGGGSIINTSSEQAFGGDLVLCAYGVSKAAVNYLTQSVATSFGRQGIRCNAVAPGLIPTPAADVMTAGAHQMILDSQMLGFHGEPRDIAHTVLFLGSDDSRFITGQILYVDGGLSGHQTTLTDRRRLTASGHAMPDKD